MTGGFWNIGDKHSVFPWSQAPVLFVGMVLVSFTERTVVRTSLSEQRGALNSAAAALEALIPCWETVGLSFC